MAREPEETPYINISPINAEANDVPNIFTHYWDNVKTQFAYTAAVTGCIPGYTFVTLGMLPPLFLFPPQAYCQMGITATFMFGAPIATFVAPITAVFTTIAARCSREYQSNSEIALLTHLFSQKGFISAKDKKNIIQAIVKEYESNSYLLTRSVESACLLNTLNSKKIDISEKWDSIISYMSNKTAIGDDFVNNGKKLSNTILSQFRKNETAKNTMEAEDNQTQRNKAQLRDFIGFLNDPNWETKGLRFFSLWIPKGVILLRESLTKLQNMYGHDVNQLTDCQTNFFIETIKQSINDYVKTSSSDDRGVCTTEFYKLAAQLGSGQYNPSTVGKLLSQPLAYQDGPYRIVL